MPLASPADGQILAAFGTVSAGHYHSAVGRMTDGYIDIRITCKQCDREWQTTAFAHGISRKDSPAIRYGILVGQMLDLLKDQYEHHDSKRSTR